MDDDNIQILFHIIDECNDNQYIDIWNHLIVLLNFYFHRFWVKKYFQRKNKTLEKMMSIKLSYSCSSEWKMSKIISFFDGDLSKVIYIFESIFKSKDIHMYSCFQKHSDT